MFDMYNKPFLDNAISAGKTIYFSHNPTNDSGFLNQEYLYIKANGYIYDPLNMIAKPSW